MQYIAPRQLSVEPFDSYQQRAGKNRRCRYRKPGSPDPSIESGQETPSQLQPAGASLAQPSEGDHRLVPVAETRFRVGARRAC